MPTRRSKPLLIVLFALAALSTPASSAVIFLYDFPGSPGSGLAANQTNSQPANATFGDFTRTGGLTQMPGAPANNTYGTESWNQTGSINTVQYEGFSITAGVGSNLNLTSLSFDCTLKPSGPANLEVGLFLNGSSTAYATLDISPTSTTTTYTFDFTDLTDTDNVTLASFRFFGWNASASGGGIILDNVATNGAISNVPEPRGTMFVLLPIGLALYSLGRRLTGKAPPAPSTKATS
jgi:hypothetical protein